MRTKSLHDHFLWSCLSALVGPEVGEAVGVVVGPEVGEAVEPDVGVTGLAAVQVWSDFRFLVRSFICFYFYYFLVLFSLYDYDTFSNQ
jgi:hypothetical protein